MGNYDNLYFLKSKDTAGAEFAKVGVSSDVLKRKASMQSGSPFKIEIMAIFNLPNAYAIEAAVKKELKQFCVLGEWFNLNKESHEKLNQVANSLAQYQVVIPNSSASFMDTLKELAEVQR